MKIVYEDSLRQLIWDEENQLMEDTWFLESSKMDADIFKQQTQIHFQYRLEYKPQYLLSNVVNFAFPISPDLQMWLANFTQKMNQDTPLKKTAIVVSKDFITQLSVEQSLDEMQFSNRKVGYFEEVEKARQWLLYSELTS